MIVNRFMWENVEKGVFRQNKTIVNRIYHLDRGYEKIETKLLKCGAQIRRLK